MTNDCKTCPVSTGTHKPAEAVHQIDEPQPEARTRRAGELLDAIRAAAPQAVQAAVPDAWAAVHFGGKRNGKIYNTCDTEKECNDYIAMVHQQSDSTTLTAKPVFFAAAPAHPAEGVAAQAATLPPLPEPTAFLVCKGSEVTARAWNVDQMRAYAADAIAATQPAAQGMEQDAARWRMVVLISRETMVHPDKRTAPEAVAAYMHAVHSGLDIQGAIDAALAAQAKQGG